MSTIHTVMRHKDEQGLVFWLEEVRMVNGWHFKQLDVLEKHLDWLKVRIPGDDNDTHDEELWLNVAHIVSLKIVEG